MNRFKMLRAVVVIFFFVGVVVKGVCGVQNKPVTNEDIRDAILSVVHMIRSTEDKLERHEYRERALGDQIKKALTTIDKRQKPLDPVKGTLSRIDERLAAVETILMQKDERERIQLEKTNELVEQIQQNLPKMFERVKNDIISSVPKDESKHSQNKTSITKTDLENVKNEIDKKIDNFSKSVEKVLDDNKQQCLHNTIKNLEDIKNHVQNNQKDKNDLLQEIQKQKSNIDHILTNVKTMADKVPKTVDVPHADAIKQETLKHIDQNTAKLQKAIENLEVAKNKNDMQPKILQSVEQQKTNSDQILSAIKAMTNKAAQPAELQSIQNETLKSLDKIKKDVAQLDGKIDDLRKASDQNNGKLQKSVEEAKCKSDLQPKILQTLEQQQKNVDQLVTNVKAITSKVPDKIAQVADVQAAMKPFEQLKKDLTQQTSAITDSRKAAEQSSAKLQKAIEGIEAKTKGDATSKVIQAIEQQKSNIDQILSQIKAITKKVPDKVAESTDIQTAKTETLKLLEQTRKDLAQQTSLLDNKLTESRKLSEQNREILHRTNDAAESILRQNIQSIQQQKTDIDQILSFLKKVPNRIADAADVQDARIETAKVLDDIKNAIAGRVAQLENNLVDFQRKQDESNTHLQKSMRGGQNDIQPVLQALDAQKHYITQILTNLQNADGQNQTLQVCNQIKDECIGRVSLIDNKLDVQSGAMKIIMNLAENRTRNDLQSQILQAVEIQQTNLDQIVRDMQGISGKVDGAATGMQSALTRCDTNCNTINKQLQELQNTAANNNVSLYRTLEHLEQQPTILQAVEGQNNNLAQVLQAVQALKPSNSEADKNETLHSLQQIKEELLGQGVLLTNKITALHTLSEKNNENLSKTIVESGEMAEQLNANVASSFENLSNSVRSLSKLDQLMVQTADAVLDTKRRVEYGVHQIVLDVGNGVKKQVKELNTTLNLRFDNLEHAMLEPQNGALSNLTTKLANEIDQVWRQISIMHEQMGANTDTLERIQTQTDSYINGSATTMDNVRGKVGQITNRMAEVDDNLNYLLGRLSLITQEFNRIKVGLGEALDQIKGSFNAVQQKIRETGPGPHKIESDEQQGVALNPPNPPKPANYQL